MRMSTMTTGVAWTIRRVLCPLLLVALMVFFGRGVSASQSDSSWWIPNEQEIAAAVDFMQRDFDRTVRGLYVPTTVMQDPAGRENILELVRSTEINSLVIDVKDDNGWITYDSSLEAVQQARARDNRLGDLEQLARELESEGIYAIARQVVFKDSRLAAARPELAIQNRAGEIWRDSLGTGWVDPHSREVWEYNLQVASEVIEAGFPEVQFDYIRFPTDGQVEAAVFLWEDESASKSQVVEGFLRRARWELAAEGGWISADVFGLVPSVVDDMGIGQHWEGVAAVVDYISPMIYPSHYGPNIYGLPVPEADPYSTTWHSVQDGMRRLEEPGAAKIRPWLQDFSDAYTYGPAEVRASIEASYDCEVHSWMLWNARGTYTSEALEPLWQEWEDE